MGEFLSSLLGWLGDLIAALIRLFPHRTVLPYSMEAVKLRRGEYPEEAGNGVIWYWPWITEIAQVPRIRQHQEIGPVVFEDAAGRTFAGTFMVSYEIADAAEWYAQNADFDMALEMTIARSAGRMLRHEDHAALLLEKLDTVLTADAYERCEEFGASVEDVATLSLAPFRPLYIQGALTLNTTEDEDDE